MGMKKTEIGMIPEDWDVQRFSDTFRILNNNTYSRAELNYASGQFRNIHYGDVLILFPEVLDCTREDVPYIYDEVRLSGSAQSLQDGDVVRQIQP
jgi:type I restriction enzyme S subunit